jgi:hypothetical protein
VRSFPESTSSFERDMKENNTAPASTKNDVRRASGASNSWISALGNKLVDTIDSSVLGIKLPHEQQHQNIRKTNSAQEQQQGIRRTSSSGSLSGTTKTVEGRRAASGYESEASIDTTIKVDLKERQRIQRERQLQFLKERGLIKTDG